MSAICKFFRNFTGQNSRVKSKFPQVTHVIFDIDGTLLRTEQIYEEADAKMIAKYGGVTYPLEIRKQVLGRTERAASGIIIKNLNLPLTIDQYRQEVDDMLDDMLKEATLMPGTEKLVKHLANNNIPIALATSSGLRSVKAKITHHQDLFSLFHHSVMGSSDPDVKNGKPAPDIFLVCARRFSDEPEPNKCLVFEDAPNGVTAALAAGMQTVFVPEPHTPKEDGKHATQTICSLIDFKPANFGLPPFKET